MAASSRWCQALTAARGAHGGDGHERLVDADGRLILKLHRIGIGHPHGPIADAALPRGNGVLIWFGTNAIDGAMARIAGNGAEVVLGRHRNPDEPHRKIWLRDPDG